MKKDGIKEEMNTIQSNEKRYIEKQRQEDTTRYRIIGLGWVGVGWLGPCVKLFLRHQVLHYTEYKK